MPYKRVLIHSGEVELTIPAVIEEREDPITGNVLRIETSPARTLPKKHKLADGSKFGGRPVRVPVTVTVEAEARALIARGFTGASAEEQRGVELDLKRWTALDAEIAKATAAGQAGDEAEPSSEIASEETSSTDSATEVKG